MPDRNAFAPGIAQVQDPLAIPRGVTPTVPEPTKRKFNIGRILRGLGGALDATGQTNRLNMAFMAQEQELLREEERIRQQQDDDAYQGLIDLLKLDLPAEDKQRILDHARTLHPDRNLPEVAFKPETIDPTELTQERIEEINAAIDRDLIPQVTGADRAQFSAEQFVDPRERRKATRKFIAESRKTDKEGTSEFERLIKDLSPEDRGKAIAARLNKLTDIGGGESAFERQVDDLVAKGIITEIQGNELTLKRLSTQAAGKKSRISVTTDPETGQITFDFVEGGLDIPLTGGQIDAIKAERDFVQRGIDTVDQLLADPQTFGLVASIAGGLRTGAKVSEDLATVFPGAQKIVDLGVKGFKSIVRPEDVPKIGKLFNVKTLDSLSLFENSLGLILARARIPRNRVPVEVIKRSIKDVKLRGIRADVQSRNRLERIRKELTAHKESLDSRLGTPSGETNLILNFDSEGNLQ